ncbi:MAG: hemolysin D, partial [Tepidisphaeraceae bacterium]
MSEQLKESRPGGLEMLSLSDQRHAASVPRPAFAWKTRVALPAMIGLITLALLAYAARDVLLPAVDVRVVPVVLKDRGGAGPSDIQAPGWVEPEPYAIA